jgi:signal transduction histidine kinase
MLARARSPDPDLRDQLIAGALGVAMLAEAIVDLAGHSAGKWIITLAAVAAMSVALAWRRRAPYLATPAFALVMLAASAAGSPVLTDALSPFVAAILAVFSLGYHGAGRPLVISATVTVVALEVAATLASGNVAGNLFFITAIVLAPPFGAGRALRHRTALLGELSARAKRLEREREERARRAALEERNRIASELHDVVAHGVSSMVVQAGAARRLAPVDGDHAREAIVAIEQTGRDALAEMRRLLGVLRRGDEDIALAPQPSLSRVRALVARARDAGMNVTLSIEGEPVPIPPGLDVAAYRVLEEALDAASGNRAEVIVRWRRRNLELEVLAAGGRDPSDDRSGLLGLRERVALFGGELSAGRRRGGGYAVRARMPLGGEAA